MASAPPRVPDPRTVFNSDRGAVYATLAYYLRHRPEVDPYLEERGRRREAVRAENGARFDPHGIRARLLARRAARAAPGEQIRTRRVVVAGCTTHPTATWVIQQARCSHHWALRPAARARGHGAAP